jgi:putative SOS response-associated peptidase YedK
MATLPPAVSRARTVGPIAFAGVCEGFRRPDDTVTRAFAIITTDANKMTAKLHDRMPVILEPQGSPTWLGVVDGVAATLLRPLATMC